MTGKVSCSPWLSKEYGIAAAAAGVATGLLPLSTPKEVFQHGIEELELEEPKATKRKVEGDSSQEPDEKAMKQMIQDAREIGVHREIIIDMEKVKNEGGEWIWIVSK